jgi:hypothetical protein
LHRARSPIWPTAYRLQRFLEVWRSILTAFSNEFDLAREMGYVIAAPSILAGIGAVAHHVMPRPPRDPGYDPWTTDQLLSALKDVNWQGRVQDGKVAYYPWDGIGGRINPNSGRFSPSGPKEVGHQVAFALENPSSEAGVRVRTKSP